MPSDLESYSPPQDVEVIDREGEHRAVLDVLKERLQSDPSIFFAGELTNPNSSGRIDVHDLFIAPSSPIFTADQLTAFAQKVMAGMAMDQSDAQLRSDGDLRLPDGYIDQVVGETEERVVTTTRINIGTYKGKTGEQKTGEETHLVKLIQRSQVKVYPDALSARAMFEYGQAMITGKLDQEQSTNLIRTYSTHILEAEQLDRIKNHYQQPEKGQPQLPPASIPSK